ALLERERRVARRGGLTVGEGGGFSGAVLVVDDHIPLAENLAEILESVGHEAVRSASTVDSALRHGADSESMPSLGETSKGATSWTIS
ncbi:MAG TPA: hypothetical protein VGF45_09235, partial [Polyangia bacterium]